MNNLDNRVPNYADYEVRHVTLVPSDPPDGTFYTAIASSSVSSPDGRTASAYGYASDIEPNQQVVDRAISESLERAIVQLLYCANSVSRSVTTTGSAVHNTETLAARAAARELEGMNQFVRRFHTRKMGRRLPNYARPYMPTSTRVASWIDDSEGFVFVALLSRQAYPQLGMGYRDSSEAGWERAVDLCVVEVAQPRPWVKKLVTESTQAPTSLEVSSPETRAVFWSTIEYPFADAVLAEIESGSDFAAPGEDLNAYLRLTRKISSGSVNTVRHTVASIPLRGERKNLHFVRVEDNVSSGVYIDAEMERSSFYSQASSGFVPHPLI